MSSESEIRQMLIDFPELQHPDVNLNKEVYAHFGLLFFGFSLVEHSMINVCTLDNAIAECRKLGRKIIQKDWEAAHDKGYEVAKSKTFGNLIKQVLSIQDFHHLENGLQEIKHVRDYATHHFFRDEIGYWGTEEGLLFLLSKLYTARKRIDAVEELLKPPTELMMKRIGMQSPEPDILVKETTAIYAEAHSLVASGAAKVGWERSK